MDWILINISSSNILEVFFGNRDIVQIGRTHQDRTGMSKLRVNILSSIMEIPSAAKGMSDQGAFPGKGVKREAARVICVTK